MIFGLTSFEQLLLHANVTLPHHVTACKLSKRPKRVNNIHEWRNRRVAESSLSCTGPTGTCDSPNKLLH